MIDVSYDAIPGPELDFNRLLVVVTGSAYAWSTPYWLEWLRLHCPELEVRVVLTRSAKRFVTPQAVGARVGGAVSTDVWPDDEATARHVEWAEWADAILVYPATLHFMGRLALGLADSPALLAAQCSRETIAVAPALPPGAMEGAAVRQHWAALSARPNTVLVPPIAGRSLTTGREDAWVPPPFPEALRLIVEHRAASSGPAADESSATADEADEPPSSDVAFGTRLLRTAIHGLPAGGRRWRREPGPLAPTPFEPAGGEEYRLLAAIGDLGDARLALGTADGPARRYDVRGKLTAAHLLLHEGPSPGLAKPLHDLGRLLRAVHDLTPPPAAPRAGTSRGLARLDTWLTGRATCPRAACAQGQVRRNLGEARWARVLDWHARTLADAETVLAHGAAGLGSLVVDRAGGGVDLLTGEDVCRSPWYVDLGWVVGELVELQWQVGGDKAAWQSLTEALFEGYDRDLGSEWNEIAALRILLHVHDFTAYVDNVDGEVDRYCDFVRFLIDLS
ncbi:flavoprotein [Streptomyces sp. NPDC048595]|uniref:flavoprotein n=1 Tax=Streptomyces sp. NPDC048595 TaxID=3365576 RepID=UPI003710CF6D